MIEKNEYYTSLPAVGLLNLSKINNKKKKKKKIFAII